MKLTMDMGGKLMLKKEVKNKQPNRRKAIKCDAKKMYFGKVEIVNIVIHCYKTSKN